MRTRLILSVAGGVVLSLAGVAAYRSGLPPPIAEGLTCDDMNDCAARDKAVDRVLNRRFPNGTSSAVLASILRAQGFTSLAPSVRTCGPQPVGSWAIDCPSWDPHWSPRNYLEYSWGSWTIACSHNLGVMWSTDKRGRITHVAGIFDYRCL